MSILADIDILKYLASDDPREHIGINPFRMDNLKGNGYDVTLGSNFYVWKEGNHNIYPGTDISSLMDRITATQGNNLVLPPGATVLAETREFIKIPAAFSVLLNGRSSLGRLFISIHQTAGDIDPGWCREEGGPITLELKNHNERATVHLPIGTPVGKLVFFTMCCYPERLYEGRYQGATEVQPSKLWLL